MLVSHGWHSVTKRIPSIKFLCFTSTVFKTCPLPVHDGQRTKGKLHFTRAAILSRYLEECVSAMSQHSLQFRIGKGVHFPFFLLVPWLPNYLLSRWNFFLYNHTAWMLIMVWLTISHWKYSPWGFWGAACHQSEKLQFPWNTDSPVNSPVPCKNSAQLKKSWQ